MLPAKLARFRPRARHGPILAHIARLPANVRIECYEGDEDTESLHAKPIDGSCSELKASMHCARRRQSL